MAQPAGPPAFRIQARSDPLVGPGHPALYLRHHRRAKGALLPHSALIGNLPGFVASQDWFPKPADVFWSPADWAWTGGMMDALLPTLYFGHPIVGTRGASRPSAPSS